MALVTIGDIRVTRNIPSSENRSEMILNDTGHKYRYMYSATTAPIQCSYKMNGVLGYDSAL